MNGAGAAHRPLSRQLADRLLARKAAVPDLKVCRPAIRSTMSTAARPPPSSMSCGVAASRWSRPISFHCAIRSGVFGALAHVRALDGQFAGSGAMPNPFEAGPSTVTVRTWLALLNFKANHPKLIVADRADGSLVGLVTSANPHDASSAHSNVGLSSRASCRSTSSTVSSPSRASPAGPATSRWLPCPALHLMTRTL